MRSCVYHLLAGRVPSLLHTREWLWEKNRGAYSHIRPILREIAAKFRLHVQCPIDFPCFLRRGAEEAAHGRKHVAGQHGTIGSAITLECGPHLGPLAGVKEPGGDAGEAEVECGMIRGLMPLDDARGHVGVDHAEGGEAKRYEAHGAVAEAPT